VEWTTETECIKTDQSIKKFSVALLLCGSFNVHLKNHRATEQQSKKEGEDLEFWCLGLR
jgi:hypothetical protein